MKSNFVDDVGSQTDIGYGVNHVGTHLDSDSLFCAPLCDSIWSHSARFGERDTRGPIVCLVLQCLARPGPARPRRQITKYSIKYRDIEPLFNPRNGTEPAVSTTFKETLLFLFIHGEPCLHMDAFLKPLSITGANCSNAHQFHSSASRKRSNGDMRCWRRRLINGNS